MSLQTKFAVLLALMGLAVIGSLAAAKWSFDMLNTAVGQPFAGTMSVLQSLGHIKRNVEAQSELIRGEPRMLDDAPPGDPDPAATDPDADPSRFDTISSLTSAHLAELVRNDWYIARVGQSTSRNLQQRLAEVDRLGRLWLAAPTPENAPAQTAAAAAAFDLHELIEAIEGKILAAAPMSSDHQEWIYRRLLTVLALTALGAALVGVLAIMFLRRWVLRPVGSVRVAAARIAAGDFDHRLPVVGADELAQLSDEVNHMAAMVRSMQDERVERERLAAVGEMVRRLAHNLRNPLAGIRGLAELTRADLPRHGDGADLRENQDRIITAVDRFERWLKELLEATSPLSIIREPTKVRPWLDGLVDAHRPAADLKGVRIVLDAAPAPEEAAFDPRHLEQALVALVTNAIDASPPGGEIRVTAMAAPDGAWEVRVADQGGGVPAELMERIFKPYFTTKHDGNGIGLAVALQVVRAHGGRIAVESGLGPTPGPVGAGAGACFRVLLPRQTPSGTADVGVNGSGTEDGGIGTGGGGMASGGQPGATLGQNTRHRGRTEPPLRDPADPRQVRP